MELPFKTVEWLAGLLEGEGCFTWGQSGTKYRSNPLISLFMTDMDVVEDARAIMAVIGGRTTNISSRRLKSGKTAYGVHLTGLPAIRVMFAILPLMGTRRSLAIRTIMKEWKPTKYKEAVAFKESLILDGAA